MNKRKTGADYEKKAEEWLVGLGYQIMEHNFRCRQGEIDLIALDGDYLVFVEVKYRSSRLAGHPAEAVDVRKQRRISQTALYYCYQKRIPQTQPCRFDVVAILGEQVEHIKNAFEFVS